MKNNNKYLGLLVILGIIFTSNIALAEENTASGSAGVSTDASVNVDRLLTPAQKKAKEEVRIKAEADFKIKLDTNKDGKIDKDEASKLKTEDIEGEIRDKAKMMKEGSGETKGDIRKEDRQEIRQEYKEERDAIRDEAKTKLEALREKIKSGKDAVKAKKQEDRLVSRERVVLNFEKIKTSLQEKVDRINEQIVKAKAIGVDVSVAESSLVTVDAKLAEVKIKTTEAYTLVSGLSVDKTLSDADKAKLKVLSTDIQKLLGEAREAMNMAVKSLKEGLKAKRLETNTSASTSTNTSTSGTTQ